MQRIANRTANRPGAVAVDLPQRQFLLRTRRNLLGILQTHDLALLRRVGFLVAPHLAKPVLHLLQLLSLFLLSLFLLNLVLLVLAETYRLSVFLELLGQSQILLAVHFIAHGVFAHAHAERGKPALFAALQPALEVEVLEGVGGFLLASEACRHSLLCCIFCHFWNNGYQV